MCEIITTRGRFILLCLPSSVQCPEYVCIIRGIQEHKTKVASKTGSAIDVNV